MAEWQALLDAILVGGMDLGGAAQAAPALGDFGLTQMSPARTGAQHFAPGRDLEPLGHGLLGLDAFWTSHKSVNFLQKERAI